LSPPCESLGVQARFGSLSYKLGLEACLIS